MYIQKNNKGLSIVFILILLLPLSFYILSSYKTAHLGNKKIENQTQTDLTLLHLSSTQADALNAIAAYNQGIEKVSNRAYLVATGLLILRACAVMTLFASPCTKYWLKLEYKIIPFYKKVQTILDYFAKQQDDIKSWAEEIMFEEIKFKNFSNIKHKEFLQLFPNKKTYRLPIDRVHVNGFLDNEDFAKGNDFKKCHNKRVNSYINVKNTLLNLPNKAEAELDVYYLDKKTGSKQVIIHKNINSKTFIQRTLFSDSLNKNLYFSYANFKKCKYFKKMLLRLNKSVPIRFKIPKPYVLNANYYKNGLNFTLTTTKNIAFQHFFNFTKKMNISAKTNNTLTALSQSTIKGSNLEKMHFSAKLKYYEHDKHIQTILNSLHLTSKDTNQGMLND